MAITLVEPTSRDAQGPSQEAKGKAGKLLAQARRRFKEVVDAEQKLRVNMLDDLRFRASEQWPEGIKSQRELDGRPVITINTLPQTIHQITNQQRARKSSPTVSPVDAKADIKTAAIFQAMIRHIEERSQVQVAYSTAGEAQATMGRGYFRLLTEFENPDSFDQAIRIKRVRNAFTIYMDPSAQELDGSDATYAFVVADLTEDQYRDKYGDKEPASLSDFSGTGNDLTYWVQGKLIRVAEYWYVEAVEDVILKLETGDTIRKSQIPAEAIIPGPNGKVAGVIVPSGAGPATVRVLKQRTTMRNEVRCATISGLAILEGDPDDETKGAPWPGRWIPIIPVVGDEIDINGVVDYRGVVRDAKEPCRWFNYAVAQMIETLALAPKSPFVATVGQIEGHEKEWASANTRNWSYLPYNPVSEAGHLVGPPQRQAPGADVSSQIMAIQQADNARKAVTGFFDASLGAPGPEQSGKAIMARQQAADIGSLAYQDNMGVAKATLARYLVDLIPKVYDAPRIIRIVGEDGQQQSVMVHAGQPPTEEPEGIAGVFDLGVGEYDVTMSAGPSYQTRRQEAVATMTSFVQAFPPAFPIVGDLLVKNMDWEGAGEMSARLKKALPPAFQEQQDGQAAPPPPELLQQLEQMQQAMQQMQAELQQAQQVISGKQVETASAEKIAQWDIQSKERIADIGAQIALAKIQAGLTEAETTTAGRPERDVAMIEAQSRETIAQQNVQAELIKTVTKAEAAEDLAGLKSNLDHLKEKFAPAPKPPKAKESV
jgi:hypothetical protein